MTPNKRDNKMFRLSGEPKILFYVCMKGQNAQKSSVFKITHVHVNKALICIIKKGSHASQ